MRVSFTSIIEELKYGLQFFIKRTNVKPAMKKLFFIYCLFTFSFIFCGCASLWELQQQWNNKNRVCSNKENLVGMTEVQLREMLGNPTSVHTSYSTRGRIDYYTYKQLSAYANVDMLIMIDNGIVTNVNYN